MDETKQIPIKKLSRKKFMLFAGLASVLLIASLVVVALYITPKSSSKNNASVSKAINGEIAYVEGKVEYKNASGWLDASTDIALTQGDSVRVLGSGKTIINLDDGSALRLNSDSEIKLVSLDPKNIVVSNVAGEVYARVAQLDRDFTVVADDISYQSLGTAYKTINTVNKKGVEVYESKVKCTDKKNVEITIEQGNKFYVENLEKKDEENKTIALVKTELKQDAFTVWNKDQDKKNNEKLGVLNELDQPEPTATIKPEPTKAPEPTATKKVEPTKSTSVTSLKISSVGSNGVKWTVTGTAIDGFKVVWSKTSGPTYPTRDTDQYHYLPESSARTDTLDAFDGAGTYYVRVCEYKDGKCGMYSNQITAILE